MDQTIRLDAKKRESAFCEEKIYPLRRGERNNVVLTVQVRADGAPYDLTGKEARLVGTSADGKLVGPCALEVSDAKAGTGSLTLPASMCAAVGTTHAYIEIREGETLVETTDSFACKVLECVDMDAGQAEEATPLIVELRDAVASAKRAAEGADAAASHQPRIGGLAPGRRGTLLPAFTRTRESPRRDRGATRESRALRALLDREASKAPRAMRASLVPRERLAQQARKAQLARKARLALRDPKARKAKRATLAHLAATPPPRTCA